MKIIMLKRQGVHLEGEGRDVFFEAGEAYDVDDTMFDLLVNLIGCAKREVAAPPKTIKRSKRKKK